MFSDSALELAIGCDAKWLYNSAMRLGRTVGRLEADVRWWRIVRLLTESLGLSLTNAERVADSVVGLSSATERVRIRASSDDAIAIAIDVARLHDSTSVQMSYALHCAVSRPRGRRPSSSAGSPARRLIARSWLPPAGTPLPGMTANLDLVLTRIPGSTMGTAMRLFSALYSGGVEWVIVGATAAAAHGAPVPVHGLDLLIEPGRSNVWTVLESMGATLVGVQPRDGFRLQAPFTDGVPALPLVIDGLSVTLWRVVPGLGDLPLVRNHTSVVPIAGVSARVASLDALIRSEVPPDVARSTGGRERWALLPSFRDALGEPR